MNKEIYEPTLLEVIRFVTEDVIATSLVPEDWEMPATPALTRDPDPSTGSMMTDE